jgi:putative glutathione S-transferase
VSLACPWAHRTLILRKLKGSGKPDRRVGGQLADAGKRLDLRQGLGSTGDKLDHFDFMHQRYTADTPDYTGRVTVPVLWDKKLKRIVSNESAEIIRMFNSAFDGLTGNELDFYPAPLRGEIDALNERIYPAVNNGVYRAGFATSQQAYEEAFDEVFAELDHLERMLGANRYLTGEYLTEADVRLFTTMIRFDAVYHGHFKCNLRRIADYPNLSNWLRELYQWPGIGETVDFSTSRITTTAATRPSTRPGLCRRGQSRISVWRMIGSGCERGLAQGLKRLC